MVGAISSNCVHKKFNWPSWISDPSVIPTECLSIRINVGKFADCFIDINKGFDESSVFSWDESWNDISDINLIVTSDQVDYDLSSKLFFKFPFENDPWLSCDVESDPCYTFSSVTFCGTELEANWVESQSIPAIADFNCSANDTEEKSFKYVFRKVGDSNSCFKESIEIIDSLSEPWKRGALGSPELVGQFRNILPIEVIDSKKAFGISDRIYLFNKEAECRSATYVSEAEVLAQQTSPFFSELPFVEYCDSIWARVYDKKGQYRTACSIGSITPNKMVFNIEPSYQTDNRTWVVLSPTLELHSGLGKNVIRSALYNLFSGDYLTEEQFISMSFIVLGEDLVNSTLTRGDVLSSLPNESTEGESKYRLSGPTYNLSIDAIKGLEIIGELNIEYGESFNNIVYITSSPREEATLTRSSKATLYTLEKEQNVDLTVVTPSNCSFWLSKRIVVDESNCIEISNSSSGSKNLMKLIQEKILLSEKESK